MVNHSFGPNDRSSGERTRGGAGASQAIQKALDTLDAESLQTLFQGAAGHAALKSPGFIFQRMQREINAGQTVERLLRVWAVLDLFSQTSLSADRRLLISAQRCVVELQAKDPASAVFVAHQALDRGLELAPQTILATVSKAWGAAETLRDLESCVSLLECGLRKGTFDRTDRYAVGQCDALLATLCDPNPCHRRISSRYKPEVNLADISGRMELGARLAEAVVEAGLVFNEGRNVERMSMTIRGLSTVGMLASLQARYRTGEIARNALMAAADEVKLRYQDLDRRGEGLDPQQQATGAAVLMRAALSIAHQCFASQPTEDGSIQAVRRYVLPGATVATLFQALERGKLYLGDSERESIAVITFCALELEQGQKGDDVRPATLNSALGLIVKKFGDLPEGGESAETAIRRADCIAYILYRALPRITEGSFLTSAIEALGAAFDANPDGEREYSLLHDAIEKRLDDIKRSQAEKEHNAPATRSTQKTTGWFSDALKEASKR